MLRGLYVKMKKSQRDLLEASILEIQGRWSLMRKGAHLRTQYFNLKLGKGRFCAPQFWPLLSNCAPNFKQVPPPLMNTFYLKS